MSWKTRLFSKVMAVITTAAILATGCLPGVTPAPTPTSVPTATPQPVPLAAELDPQIDTKHFKMSDPIVVHFTTAMDVGSSQVPIMSFPYVTGDATWDASRTTLTFRPDTALEPGSTYTVFLDPALASTSGETFAQTPQWNLRVQPGPEVLRVFPAPGELNSRMPALIEVTFDQMMDPVSTEAAFSIQPPVEYQLSWRDNNTVLKIELLEQLELERQYNFLLAGANAQVQAEHNSGIVLQDDYLWSYWVPALEATVLVENRYQILVTFSQSLDTDEIGNPFVIQPELAGVWKWLTNDKAQFTRSHPMPYGQRYTLTIQSHEDLLPLVQTEFSFDAPAPIRLVEPRPEDEWDAFPSDTSLIRIKFDILVDHASAEAAFHITPAIPGTISWRTEADGTRDVLEFFPDIEFSCYTDYEVSIDTTVKDLNNKPILLETYSWSIPIYCNYYARGNSFGVLGSNIQVVDTDGPRVIQFSAGEDVPIRFDLYGFSMDEYTAVYSKYAGYHSYREPISIAKLENHHPLASWEYLGVEGLDTMALPPDIPAGLYLLDMVSKGEVTDQLFVILTRNTLMVKRSGDELLIWASDINGATLPGADICLYSTRGEKLRQGKTDGNGIFKTTIPQGYTPLFVSARVDGPNGNDYTISGINGDWQTSYGYARDHSNPYRTYAYTDRPIYSPGQIVNFKVVVREDNDARYTTPEAGLPVIVNIRDTRHNLLQHYELTTNEFGTVNDAFSLIPDAMLGEYGIEVVMDGNSETQVFKVQDYRKPDFEVSITPADPTQADTYITGEKITLLVDTQYYFGEPVAGASVSFQTYVLESSYYWDENDYTDIRYWDRTSDLSRPTYSLITDAGGSVSFSVTPKVSQVDAYSWDYEYRNRMKVYAVEVTVDDGSHQTVSATYVFGVYDSALFITMDEGGFLKRPGESFTVSFRAADKNDAPVAGQALKFSIRGWSRDFWNGRTIAVYDLVTDSEGNCTQVLTLEAGFYKLKVSGIDANGSTTSYIEWIYVYDHEWFNRINDSVEITSEKDSYKPYETAQFLIESSFSGPALLTFEREHVIHSISIVLTAPMTVIRTQIISEYGPNVFVTVNAWQPASQVAVDDYEDYYWYTNEPDSYLRLASTEIAVDISYQELQVDITTDLPVYAPGQPITVTLDVHDWLGNPVEAELSLALVDEAIFALSEELAPDIFEAFYAPRRKTVETYDSMSPFRLIIGNQGERGGGGDGYSPPAGLRSEFLDTAAWFPVLRTDKNGRVTVTFDLPDNLTTWRLTAKAISYGSMVGEATAQVQTKKELIVRPILPEVLTTGDWLELTALVHNYGISPRAVDVSLQAAGLEFQLPIQTVTIQPGEALPVTWSVTVTGASETLVTVSATSSDGVQDAVQLPLILRPPAEIQIQGQSGSFKGSLQLTLPAPIIISEASEVFLELSTTPRASILNGLDYLIGYPYGCIEQVMSRALPNAVVSRAADALGIGGPELRARLDPMVIASIQRIYAMQHDDGGWGWWYDDDSDPYQTAWVLFGLGLIADANYQVDEGVIERASEYLSYNLDEMDIRTRAYALYSKAMAGHGNLQDTKTLASESLYELDPFSQAALALAFHELGESEQAEEVLDVLNEHAIYIGEHVYWAQPTHDGQYNRKTMASTLRTTALILDAYVAIRPDSELIPGMANYLFAERKPSFGWGTTNETSFAILALTDYFILQEQASGQAPVKVDLNGNLLGSGILAPGQATIRYEIPADQLTTGLNSLALTAAGDAEVFYDLSIRFSLPKNQIEPAGNLTILRQYLDPVTSHPLEFIVPGQLVKIVLSVSWSSGDQFFMLVEDHLPGGLEALNENLNTTSYVGDDEYFKNWMWNEYGYNYKEIRDNSVTFFITRLTGRTRVFRYLARATIAGEFTALPAEAYAMYDPKVWGRSASDRIVILTPEEVEVVLHSQSTPIPTNDLPVDEAVPVLP